MQSIFFFSKFYSDTFKMQLKGKLQQEMNCLEGS